MRVAILHNEVSAAAAAEERDVLAQLAVVSEALSLLGQQPEPVGCSLNLDAVRRRLLDLRPAVVFNLVESLGGSDWLAPAASALLDSLGAPYTGSPTEALFLSTHKLLAKECLRQAGLPTPAWFAGDPIEESQFGDSRLHDDPCGRRRFIIKRVTEHASVGIDDSSVVDARDEHDLRVQVDRRAAQLRSRCFAEQYIDGREFNLSLLAGPAGPQILPPAEIDFSSFPAEQPRIVGYQAKWREDSFEYMNTPRRFDFPAADQPLLDRLGDLAIRCWRLFGLRGYARVDFRVDAAARPWILEVNANPCLSPDAGFAAALNQAGIPFAQAIQRIVDEALAPNGIRGGRRAG